MVKAEVVKQVTGVHVELNAKEAKDLYVALANVLDELDVGAANSRPKRPGLKPIYVLYDLLYEGGFAE